jgi:hypothetical protein
MRQNATPPKPDELKDAPAAALAVLLAGKTVTEAAAAANVCRQTVHRWLKEDPLFVAELNRGRRELRTASMTRLERLVSKALDAVEKALEAGDLPVALAVLRGLGVLSGKAPYIGSDDPEVVAGNFRRENRDNKLLNSF